VTCLVRVGTEAEVLDGLTGVLGATEEEGVGTGRGAHGQLIDGQGLTTSGDNAGAGSVGVAEGSDRELGELKKTVVVSDGADQDDGLALVSLAGVLVGSGGNDLGERHGRAVDLAHVQTAEDSGVELAVGTAFAQKKCQSYALVDFHAAICRRASSSTAAAADLRSFLSMLAWSAAGGAEWAVASMAVFGKGFLTGQESVELDEQSGVRVVRLRCLAVARTDVVVVQTKWEGTLAESRGTMDTVLVQRASSQIEQSKSARLAR
jgi:hypothetical protein